MNVFGTNSLLFQTVTRKVFEVRLMVFFSSHGSTSNMLNLDEEMSEDEKNVIMYACSYVPVALIHRYEKRKQPNMLCLFNVFYKWPLVLLRNPFMIMQGSGMTV